MKKLLLFIILLICLIPLVCAETDYSYWDTHYVPSGGGGPASGSPPHGIMHLYSDASAETWPTLEEMCTELETTCLNGWPYFRVNSQGANYASFDYSQPVLSYSADAPIIGGIYVTGTQTVFNHSILGLDGYAMQNYIYVSGKQWVAYGPMIVIHSGIAPLEADFDYTPSNPTIDDTIEFISLSTPKNKIDSYFWTVEDSGGELRASALNMDTFSYKGLSAGDYNVTLTVGNTNDSNYNSISKIITVASGVEVINRVNIKDASTQSLISGAELQIFNHNNDAWVNSSYLYTGSTIFPANQTDVVDIYAQAEKFFPAEKLGYIIPKTGGIISLLLSPDAPATNESLNRIQIIVKDDDSSDAIANVKLTVNQGDNSIIKYTNNDGYAVFELDPELIANILAEKSGYYELSKILDISSPSSVDELRLIKILVAPTPTYAVPTPTLPPGQTGGGYNPVTGEYEPYYDPETGVYVTPTFVGGWGETEFEENICIKAPYPSNWGYMDILQNGIACNGVKGAVNQKLILSLIIITLIALVLSRYAKGTGALAGGIVGSLVCMGMGLLPVWIAILMIVICGIVIAKMIIGGAK